MTDIMKLNLNAAEGHIVAMGGGGFSMEPNNPLLDDFVLGLSRRKPARVCFVPTASADAATYIVRFYRAFVGRCIPTDLTLWNATALPRQPQRTSDLADFIAEQDVIYVGGGDTANLLVLGVVMASTCYFAVPGLTERSWPASVQACCAGRRDRFVWRTRTTQ